MDQHDYESNKQNLILAEDLLHNSFYFLDGSSIVTGPNLLKSKTAMMIMMKEINKSMPLIENQFPLFVSFSRKKHVIYLTRKSKENWIDDTISGYVLSFQYFLRLHLLRVWSSSGRI